MNIDLEQLRSLPLATDAEIANIHNRLDTQQPAFILERDYLAVLAFGGTIQSAYVPAAENIKPVAMNPVFDRTSELSEKFGLASKAMTGAILIAKDSRDVTNADLISLIHAIQHIPNERIVVSCGTYMLPFIAQALDMHLGQGKSGKIIGVTGSWLPPSLEGQDVDYNAGGAVAAVNAFAKAGQKGIVFAQFHGEIVMGDDLVKLDLHLPNINPRLARPRVDLG